MDESLQPLIWWIAAVDVPIIGSLVLMILHSRRDQSGRFDAIRNIMDESHDDLWQSVTDFKLVVARSYASNDDLKDVEQRLIAHLLRIESKLENQRQVTLPGYPDPPIHSNRS
jgi:hypothetical protein